MGVLSSLNEARKDATDSLRGILNDAGKTFKEAVKDAGGDISGFVSKTGSMAKKGSGQVRKAGKKLTKIIEDAGEDIYEGQKDVVNFVVDDTKFLGKKVGDVAGKALSGNFDEAWDEVKSTGGEHQRMMTDNLVDLGFSENNWITQNSDTVAAAIAAWYLAPEIGAGGVEGGASAGEIAQAQTLADTVGSGMASGLGAESYGIGSLTAEQTGAYLGSLGDTWMDTAKEWGGNLKKAKNIYDVFNPPQMPGQQQQGPPSIGTGRNANYNNMLDRLKTEIDPYQELTNPAGARY